MKGFYPVDCETCGACCAHAGNGAADIRESVLTSNTADIICVSFSGRVGERCGCRIYANRPEECREFEVGSEQCADARRIAGI